MKQTSSHARRGALIIVAGAVFAASVPVRAQVLAPEIAAAEALPDDHWGLGLGAGYTKSPYRQFDDKARALPLILYDNRWISVFGTKLDVKLPAAGPVSLRLRAHYAGDGYEADDSPYLAGMAERKGGVWLGAAAVWRNDVANVAAEALAATGDAQGKRFRLEVNHAFRSGAFAITPRVSADWYDSGYVDYYYGVRSDEVRADRPRYVGDSTTSVAAGVRFSYALSRQHHLFVDISATRLGGAIQDSPLVERASERSVRLGYLYAF